MHYCMHTSLTEFQGKRKGTVKVNAGNGNEIGFSFVIWRVDFWKDYQLQFGK